MIVCLFQNIKWIASLSFGNTNYYLHSFLMNWQPHHYAKLSFFLSLFNEISKLVRRLSRVIQKNGLGIWFFSLFPCWTLIKVVRIGLPNTKEMKFVDLKLFPQLATREKTWISNDHRRRVIMHVPYGLVMKLTSNHNHIL